MISALLIVLGVCSLISGVPIDSRLEEYCKTLLAIFEKDPGSELVQGIIEPWVCRSLDAMEESDYFLPKVLIWCPLTRFSLPLKCPTHGNALRTGVWKVSTKLSCEPRLLFDLYGNTLLVARYYVCSSRGVYHRILSSDQLLLEQVQKDLEVPFILSHRSGYTLRFLTHVRVEIGLGINFNEISQSIMKMNLENFTRRRSTMVLIYNHHRKQASPKYLDDSEFSENPLYAYPSDDHIREMFLMNFRQTRSIYEGDMKKLSASSVSMFHTFKVCNKVGTTRSSDDKWVTEHGCLFIIVNERGEIIKWAFCTEDKFDEIKVLLQELSGRLGVHGRLLTHAMVERCCEWRPLLMEIFGSHLLVKQDLYHACQILRENFSVDFTLKQSCFDDFDLVFRDLDDRGTERLKPTPGPDVLKFQLDSFIQKWEGMLSKEARRKLKEVEAHIQTGCFSDIPVGHGVQKNEDLTDLLNKSLVNGATRVGPELAFALITVLFYIVNGKLRRKKQLYDVPNHLGPCREIDGESFGFLPSMLNPAKDNSLPGQMSADGMGSLNSTNVQTLLRENILQILVPEALELHDILQQLNSRCTVKSFDVWNLSSIHPDRALSLLAGRFESNENEIGHGSRLAERLEQFNLEIQPVDKDGNCAFTSVAYQIKHALDRGSEDEFRSYLSTVGLKENQPVSDMARYLRFLFVREITSNLGDYFPYTHNLTQEMYLEEARAFQFDGVFTSQLGDFVMKGLSKALRCAILVITSMPAVEVVPFIPAGIKCKTPLFVAYNHQASGHYDSTLDKPQSDGTSDSGMAPSGVGKYASTQGKCRCGRGKQSGAAGDVVSCTNKSGRGKYLTRCPCFRLKQGCTAMCRCLNCGNEYTTEAEKEEMSREKVLKRKRNTPESKKRKKGEDFINEVKQQLPVSQTAWSPFESCVLEASLRFLTLSGVDYTPDNVLQMYNFIAKSTCVSTMGLELRCKTLSHVESKLSSRKESGAVIDCQSAEVSGSIMLSPNSSENTAYPNI